MILNQFHYMSLSISVINYGDIKQCFLTNAKDESITFTPTLMPVEKYGTHYLSTSLKPCFTAMLLILIACLAYIAVSCMFSKFYSLTINVILKLHSYLFDSILGILVEAMLENITF